MPQTAGPTVKVGNTKNRAVPTWNVAYPPPGMAWLGYEKITSLATVQTLSPPTGTQVAMVKIEAGNARYLSDEDPTGDLGMPFWGTETLSLTAEIEAYRFINMTGSSGAALNVIYYG